MSKTPPIPSSKPASDLAAQLRSTLSKLQRRLREQGGSNDLTPSQVSVLLHLETNGAATVSSLARAEAMRPQSMSSIVTSLQNYGLVDSSSDPNDGRQTLISLSSKCVKLLRKSRAAKQDWLTNVIIKRLSTHEQQTVAAALQLLSRLSETEPHS